MTTAILNSEFLILDRALKCCNHFLATIDDFTVAIIAIIAIIVYWLEMWVLNAQIVDLSCSLFLLRLTIDTAM